MKFFGWLIPVLIFSGLIGCGQLLPTGTVSQGQQLIYRDDFSNPSSGWTPGLQGKGEAAYFDGVFRLAVDQPYQNLYAEPGLNLEDVSISVEAIKIGGDRNNRFGIVCRLKPPGSYYVFLVSSDGYYGIGKVKGLDYQLLGSQALLPSPKIPQGSAYVRLRADCIKDRLTLFVNGEKLAETNDAEFTAGDVGIFAGAYAQPGVEILFDNFSVYKP
jgi:hypothetical protein